MVKPLAMINSSLYPLKLKTTRLYSIELKIEFHRVKSSLVLVDIIHRAQHSSQNFVMASELIST
jgi:hypothetical protein